MNMNQTTNSIRGLMLVLLLVVMSVFSFGQSRAVNSSSNPADGDIAVAKYPHPYLYGGLQLNGGGYSPTAWVGGAGLDIELAHLVFDASAGYTRDTRQTTTQSTTMPGTTGAWTVISSTASTSCTSEAELRGVNCQPPTTRSNPGIRTSAWDATGSEKLFHSVGRWFTNCRGATI